MQESDTFTRRLLETSDQIVEINRRILERARIGEPRCEADDELLAQLMAEMERPRPAAA
jgi:hypothetical protein